MKKRRESTDNHDLVMNKEKKEKRKEKRREEKRRIPTKK